MLTELSLTFCGSTQAVARDRGWGHQGGVADWGVCAHDLAWQPVLLAKKKILALILVASDGWSISTPVPPTPPTPRSWGSQPAWGRGVKQETVAMLRAPSRPRLWWAAGEKRLCWENPRGLCPSWPWSLRGWRCRGRRDSGTRRVPELGLSRAADVGTRGAGTRRSRGRSRSATCWYREPQPWGCGVTASIRRCGGTHRLSEAGLVRGAVSGVGAPPECCFTDKITVFWIVRVASDKTGDPGKSQ